MKPRTDAPRLHDAARALGPARFAGLLGLMGGPVLREGDGSVRVPCPVHGGKDPNCKVFLGDDGIAFVCFSACGGKGGDALALVAAVEGLDVRSQFPAVLERAAELLNVDLEPRAPGSARRATTAPRPPPRPAPAPTVDPEAERQHEQRCAMLAALWPTLELRGDALPYLAERGLAPGGRYDAATRLGVRWLPPGEDWLAPLRARWTDAELEAVGLTRARWAHHPLVFPLYDSRGRIGWMQGRTVAQTTHDKRWTALKGDGASRCLFGAHELAARPDARVWLLEGPTDTLAATAYRPAVVAVGRQGAGRLSPAQAAMLRGRHVFVAFDPDPAGNEGARACGLALQAVGARGFRLRPDGKDVAEWLVNLARERQRTEEERRRSDAERRLNGRRKKRRESTGP